VANAPAGTTATTGAGLGLVRGPGLGGLSYLPLQLPASYRKIYRVEGTVPYAANGQSNPLRIDPSGLLGGLLLTFSGTLTTTSTAPTLTNGSPYSIVKYFTLSTSGGVGRSINIPGYALNVMERLREPDYADGPVTPTTASSTLNWSFDLYLSVCVRDGDIYGGWSDLLGAIYTGDPQVTCNFSVTWNSESTIISNQTSAAAVLAGSFTVTSSKWDTPTPDADMNLLQAISWTHQLIEEIVQPITGSGPLGLPQLPTYEQRVYLKICDLVLNNGAYTNGVYTSIDSSIQNFIDFEQSIPESVWLARQRRRYINVPPAGTYCLDFAAGNSRSLWLPVQNVTLWKVAPTISTVALTAASVDRISESMVPSPLARKWVQIAAQAGGKVAA
jgi:hypothetical protein